MPGPAPQNFYSPVQSVAPATGMPNDYLNVHAHPEEFGQQVGQALERTGAVTEDLAQKQSDLALSYQQMNNQITAISLNTDYANYAGQALQEFRTNYRGQNAAAQLPVFQKTLQDRLNQVAQNIPSLPARVAFLQDARSFYDRAAFNAGAYVSDELNKATIASWNGRLNTIANKATLFYNDPVAIDQAINDTAAASLTIAQMKGYDKDAAESEASQNVGNVITRAVLAQLAQGVEPQEKKDSADAANDLLQKYLKAEIPNMSGVPMLDAAQQDRLQATIQQKLYTVQIELDHQDDKANMSLRTNITANMSAASSLISKGVINFDDARIPTHEQIDQAYKKNPELAEKLKEQADDLIDQKHFLDTMKNATPEQIIAQEKALFSDPNVNFEDAGRRARQVDALDRLYEGKIRERERAEKAVERGEIIGLGREFVRDKASLSHMSNEQADQIDSRFEPQPGDSDAVANRKLQLQMSWNNAKQTHIRQLQDDPASYVMRNDGKLEASFEVATKDLSKFGDYANATISQQRLLGLDQDQVHLIPRDRAQAFVRKLEGQPDGLNTQLNNLRTSTGVYWPQIYRDLVQYGKLSPQSQSLQLLDTRNSEILSQFIGKAGKDEKALNDFLPKVKGNTAPFTTIKQQVSTDPWVQNYIHSLGDSHFAPEEIQGVQDSISTLAAGLLWHDRLDSTTTAVQNAVKAFQQTTDFVGGARVPKEHVSIVSENASRLLEDLSPTTVQVPSAITDRLKTNPHSVTPDEWLNQIKSNPHWITSPAGDSMRLLGPDGKFVKDNKGVPIELHFSEPLRPTNKPPKQLGEGLTFAPAL